MANDASPAVQIAPTAELGVPVLYGILQLRSRVFVVEQECVFLDLDGRDLEADCEQLWIEQGGVVAASLRLLTDPDAQVIGRVVTAPEARGAGLAGSLMRHAVARCRERAPGAVIRLEAQEHLADWYATFGFARAGTPYLEDGIRHVTMTLGRGL